MEGMRLRETEIRVRILLEMLDLLRVEIGMRCAIIEGNYRNEDECRETMGCLRCQCWVFILPSILASTAGIICSDWGTNFQRSSVNYGSYEENFI